MDVEAELDRLYSVPLEQFVEERNRIAQAVTDSGDSDSAAAIKKLSKPSVAAWALNQVARKHPAEIDELLQVRTELETAGSPTELRTLAGRRRETVARVTTLAKEILEGAGHNASHSTLEKVSQGLLAGGSEEERGLLRRGRLTREPAESGLDAFGMTTEVGQEVEDSAPKVPLKTQREVERLRREAERLQQEAARLAHEAEFAEEQARRTRAQASEAGRAADEARARAEDAAREAGL